VLPSPDFAGIARTADPWAVLIATIHGILIVRQSIPHHHPAGIEQD
jgi:hypothetical protein